MCNFKHLPWINRGHYLAPPRAQGMYRTVQYNRPVCALIQADTILIFLLLWTTFSSITKFTQSQVCLGWNWFLSKSFINIRFKVQHWVGLHYCYGSRGMGFSGLLSLCSDSLPSSGVSSPLPVLICIIFTSSQVIVCSISHIFGGQKNFHN